MAKQREIIEHPSNDVLSYLEKNGSPVSPDRVVVYVKVDDRDTEKEHWYTMYRGPKEYIAALNAMDKAGDTAGIQFLFDRYDYALGLYERATVREAVAAESTVIMVGKSPVDLMTFPLDKLIRGINGTYDTAETTGKPVPSQFRVARKRLLEKGLAKLQDASKPEASLIEKA